MKRKTDISVLIKNFQTQNAGSEDLSNLYASLKEGSDDFDRLIDDQWESVSDKAIGVNSHEILNQIHKKGNFKTSQDSPLKEDQPSLFRYKLIQYSKYAAIFIIAFLSAWFLRNTGKTPENSSITNVTVAYGSKSTIELPDGSVVVLNSGSKLTYPTNFGKDSRTVFLSGEGFFEVRKNTKWPFYVKTNGMTVKVTGTKFNVKAYPDETITETTLVSGSVEILEDKKESPLKLLAVLKPNQKAVFNRGKISTQELTTETKEIDIKEKQTITHIAKPLDIEESVKTDDMTCWKNNVLIINNEKLSELTKKLERWYDVEITLKDERLANIRFSGKFDKETIQEVLNALMFIQPFTYDINKNKIYIKSKFN